ncbi:MAG: hypothetical protein Q4P66_08210, partial [Actinomycetaceae bacterium]|nr:hypothetical protein [Actinomycetaceae bacterium]
ADMLAVAWKPLVWKVQKLPAAGMPVLAVAPLLAVVTVMMGPVAEPIEAEQPFLGYYYFHYS